MVPAAVPDAAHAMSDRITVERTRAKTPLPVPAAGDSARLLLEQPLPLIDAESERRIVRVTAPIVVAMFVAGLALYLLPADATTVDRALLRRWLPIMGLDIATICALMVAVVRTQQRSRARFWVNRAVTLLAIASITVAMHLTGSLTSYDMLYYPLLVIVDRLRADRSLARVTLIASLTSFASTAIAEHVGALPYAPLYPGRIAPALVADRGLLVLTLLVAGGVMLLSYRLTDFLATRVQKREAELRQLGLGLAGRLDEQLELLRRSEDLRRYLSPQLAEAILRGDAAQAAGHQRRRLTLVRVDCPAIAHAAEAVEPEEFAVLLNDFFARVADLAAAHGGTVDRLAGAELSVLFGAPESQGAAADALAAVGFARAAVPAVGALALRCEAAGIEEPARGRAAVHTGYATVGSFGSPARLEYTAVGPHVAAAAVLLDGAPADAVLLTHATWVLVRDAVTVEPAGERPLPGARHPVKLYRLT